MRFRHCAATVIQFSESECQLQVIDELSKSANFAAHSLRRMEKQITMNWLVKANVCPGLFYGTHAQDGFLIRIRTPGGLINSKQGKLLGDLLTEWGGTLQVTNRANLQIRGVQKPPTSAVFEMLQKLNLAAQNPHIDHLRNIMGSPTAGIDSQELIDTRPLIKALDNLIQNHPLIGELSPKFSIGVDGGGTVGIGIRSPVAWEHRYNEIQLNAISVDDGNNSINFQLAIAGDKKLYNTQLVITPEQCLSVVATLINVYGEYVRNNPLDTGKKPRMKQLIDHLGLDTYIQQVNSQLTQPLPILSAEPTPSQPYHHLGIYPQKNAELCYIGISLHLGQINAQQWLGLVELSETFGNAELRLTPWQTIIMPDIPHQQISQLLPKLSLLGFAEIESNQVAIAACGGKPGCAASLTHTQTHASQLAEYLHQRLNLDTPINIHVTGCPKFCAQPSPAEITLLGHTINQNGKTIEGYQVYLGDGEQSLKQKIFEGVFTEIPEFLANFLTQNRPLN